MRSSEETYGGGGGGGGLRRVAMTLDLWRERRRSRAELGRLSAYQLKDIGLSPGEARMELEKPFWRP